MSYDAVNWAIAQEIPHSSAKFVLVVMAHHANKESWEAWLSVAKLAQSTGQDRKTVMSNISRLQQMGFISDTGKRAGETKQVPVFVLNSTKIGTAKSADTNDEGSTGKGTVKQSQKRDSTENGTVPIFPSNSTVFPLKQYQFSPETVPKTVHGTSKNLKSNQKGIEKHTRELPDWIPDDAWNAFVAMRKKIKAPMTDDAERLAIKSLEKLMNQGHSPRAVLEQSTLNSWRGLFEIKGARQQANGYRETRDEFNARENARAKELLFGPETDNAA